VVGNAPLSTGESTFIPPDEALTLIQRRKKVLGGVVISGGEPTIHPALRVLIGEIHKLGLPVKLDTNGMNPSRLRELWRDRASQPDYIALDLKLAPGRYKELLSGSSTIDPAAALTESAALVRDSGVAHEFRSLALPDVYFGTEALKALAPLTGNSPWHIRPFIPGNCLDPVWDSLPATETKEIARLREMAKGYRNGGNGGGRIVRDTGARSFVPVR
jgi:pyruvate formate lyase activating enzyme